MNLFRKPANLKKATHSEQEKLWNARSDGDYISVVNNFERVAEPFPDTARRALNAMSGDRIYRRSLWLWSNQFVLCSGRRKD
jgi:hypothetical protein